jgi:hypothetical protein
MFSIMARFRFQAVAGLGIEVCDREEDEDCGDAYDVSHGWLLG